MDSRGFFTGDVSEGLCSSNSKNDDNCRGGQKGGREEDGSGKWCSVGISLIANLSRLGVLIIHCNQ